MSKKVRFYHKATCVTCRRAKELLLGQGANLEERDLVRQPLSEAEIDALIGSDDHRKYLRPKHPLYRERRMNESPPSRAEAVRLMAADPNLIHRPLAIAGGDRVIGFDREALQALVGAGRRKRPGPARAPSSIIGAAPVRK
jgi:arsenate reductase